MTNDSHVDSLRQAIATKKARVGVIGLGYVGLPLIRAFVEAGFRTLGFDVDRSKVDRLLAGGSYIAHIPSESIKDWLALERFEPTCDMHRLGEADALLICVPTPLTESRDPDLSYIESTGRQIAAELRPGQLVVLESTTYPGTTSKVLLPLLEERGLKVGRDFFSLQSRARRSRQPPLHGSQYSQSRGWNRCDQPRSGPGVISSRSRHGRTGLKLRSG